MATILHAVTLPPDGGDTCFADMSAAYDPELRKLALEAAADAGFDAREEVY